MTATFIQIEPAELSRIQADPSLAETLFEEPTVPPGLLALSKRMQERVRSAGPRMLSEALKRLDPAVRQQVEARLGQTAVALASGAGGDEILKMMQERAARFENMGRAATRPTLSLDKAWHGVHYLLCGELEPGASLLSRPVLGGVELGEGDGFSGHGPARCFTPAEVTELAQALGRPEIESETAARFDAERMTQLGIYPGWRAQDQEWVLNAFRSLRSFYSDAAGNGRAIVTCLV